jgi:four helix bundle protein
MHNSESEEEAAMSEASYTPRYADLRDRSKAFACRIIRLYRALPKTPEAKIIGGQLLRCGTSVGANYRAACRARSRADFISKMGIVLEEADESDYWLDLLVTEKIMPAHKMGSLQQECQELIQIFVASLNTAEAGQPKRNLARV